MERINLNKFSIDDLNMLAMKIIDELSERDNKEISVGKNNLEKLMNNSSEEEKLRHKLNQLQIQSEEVEEEIYETEELLEEFEYEQTNLWKEISMGMN